MVSCIILAETFMVGLKYLDRLAELILWGSILLKPILQVSMGAIWLSLFAASNIISLPLAFVRSGWVNLNDGTIHVIGQYGYNWSRTSRSITSTYVLDANPTNVSSSSYGNRFVGRPLHCLCMLEGTHEKIV